MCEVGRFHHVAASAGDSEGGHVLKHSLRPAGTIVQLRHQGRAREHRYAQQKGIAEAHILLFLGKHSIEWAFEPQDSWKKLKNVTACILRLLLYWQQWSYFVCVTLKPDLSFVSKTAELGSATRDSNKKTVAKLLLPHAATPWAPQPSVMMPDL